MPRDEDESRESAEQGLLEGKAVSRREFLKFAGIAGAVVGVGGGLGGLLAACGGSTTTTTAAGPTTTAAVGASTTASTSGASTTAVSTGGSGPGKAKIVIGAARPISGSLSFFEANAFGPAYKMWVKEVNDAGGLNIMGAKVPIELKIYDDQSNLDNTTRLLTKLMEEDKVDFILPPTSTAFLFAAAGVANAHKYILISGEGGATSLEKEMNAGKLPYYYQFLSYSDHNQVPVLADILKEVGAKSCVFLYIDDLHGIEYQSVAQYYLPAAGIQIVQNTAIPADIKDISSVLKQAQKANPDVLWCECYPDQNILCMKTLLQLNYNPKMIGFGPGGNYQFMYNAFAGQMENVASMGAWNAKSSPGAKDLVAKLTAFLGGKTDNIDWWGHSIYWGELSFFQQSIETANTLNQDAIRDVMNKTHFQTVLGDTFITNQQLDISCYLGQIGQWQKGIFEVIDPGVHRTAPPVYPKPAYPAPATAPST